MAHVSPHEVWLSRLSACCGQKKQGAGVRSARGSRLRRRSTRAFAAFPLSGPSREASDVTPRRALRSKTTTRTVTARTPAGRRNGRRCRPLSACRSCDHHDTLSCVEKWAQGGRAGQSLFRVRSAPPHLSVSGLRCIAFAACARTTDNSELTSHNNCEPNCRVSFWRRAGRCVAVEQT